MFLIESLTTVLGSQIAKRAMKEEKESMATSLCVAWAPRSKMSVVMDLEKV